jgi:hypothetical protein
MFHDPAPRQVAKNCSHNIAKDIVAGERSGVGGSFWAWIRYVVRSTPQNHTTLGRWSVSAFSICADCEWIEKGL